MARKPSDRDLSEETCSTGVRQWATVSPFLSRRRFACRQPRDTALRPLTPISNKDRTDEASKPPPKHGRLCRPSRHGGALLALEKEK